MADDLVLRKIGNPDAERSRINEIFRKLNAKIDAVTSAGDTATNANYLVTQASGALSNEHVLQTSGTVVVNSSPGVASLAVATGSITNPYLGQMPARTFKGNATGATAAPTDMTVTQATGLLRTFTASSKGLVAPPIVVVGNFLRDDNTWQPVISVDGNNQYHAPFYSWDSIGVVNSSDTSSLSIDSYGTGIFGFTTFDGSSTTLTPFSLNPYGVQLLGSVAYPGIYTDTLTTSRNDYLPTPLNRISVLGLTATSNVDITGFDATGVAGGGVLSIRNEGSSNSVTLKHNSGSSSAVNRMYLPGLQDVVLAPGDAITLIYEINQALWFSYASKYVASGGGGGGIASGTSFPGSPSTNDLFQRTDLGFLCYYDGTRWLTTHEYEVIPTYATNVPIFSASVEQAYFPLRTDHRPYLTRWAVSTFVAGASNDASNYWTVTLRMFDTSASPTTVTSINTSADTPSFMTGHDVSINAPLGAAGVYLGTLLASTGSPSGLYPFVSLFYRLIIT